MNFSSQNPHIFGLSQWDNSLFGFLRGIANSADDNSSTTVPQTDKQHEHDLSSAKTSSKPKQFSTTQKPEKKSDSKSAVPELDLTFRSIMGLANISRPLNINQGKYS